MASLTQEQYREYVSKLTIKLTYERKPPIKVDRMEVVEKTINSDVSI